MISKELTQRYYKGELSFINDVPEHVDLELITKKEQNLMEKNPFGDGISNENGENDFAVLDDVNTLKNLMAFAEITRYKETLLVDMTEKDRNEVTQRIINNLDMFHVKPVGYEIKKDSIVVAWYLNSVINTFTFSDQSTALID
ncbi:hypothetical protein LCD52_21870 [Rossellomorea vietnamensis]|uniref:hypothetical protein n=1 Tax=Rossellomorea vietnamensis TaxID=218284 RepID=UPI001CCDCFA9|nr:hypothetical protein [Rossellomorea vietnamensis]MCA0151352.1 hypothetical protein [Rossellomorea vietnamensis]